MNSWRPCSDAGFKVQKFLTSAQNQTHNLETRLSIMGLGISFECRAFLFSYFHCFQLDKVFKFWLVRFLLLLLYGNLVPGNKDAKSLFLTLRFFFEKTFGISAVEKVPFFFSNSFSILFIFTVSYVITSFLKLYLCAWIFIGITLSAGLLPRKTIETFSCSK